MHDKVKVRLTGKYKNACVCMCVWVGGWVCGCGGLALSGYATVLGPRHNKLPCLVQEAILPGVFNLLKLCTANDIAFIKASVDMATRDSFQTLMDEYQRYHKFGGKV